MKVEAGHRIGVLTGTTGLHVSLHAAADEQGFTLIPVPMRDPPKAMGAHLDAARADVIVTDEAHASLAQQIRGQRPVLVCDDRGAPVREVEGALGPPHDPDTYAVLRTSGTTGPARIVEIPRAALEAHAEAAKKRLGAGPGSIWLATLPLWHIGGVALVHRCLHGGGRLVLQDGFDAQASVHAMQAEGVTHVSLVPTMLHRIMALAPEPPASLRCVLVGGDGLPPATVRHALDAGWPLHVSYGLTEACSQVATATPADLHRDPATCGRPLDGVRVAVEDEQGPLEPGQTGQIVVEGATLAAPGRLQTGDLGRLDQDGRLTVVGRLDDRITTGGEKVDAARVEAALCSHPDVAEAAVVGIPDAEWGQRVVGAVVLRDGALMDEQALLHAVRRVLAPHEVPKGLQVVARLPRTAEGKLLRQAVRRQWPAN